MPRKSFFKSLAATTLIGVSSLYALNATANQQLQDTIYQATINSFYSANGFYNFSANLAHEAQDEEIQAAIESVAQLMDEIANSEATENNATLTDAALDNWYSYEEMIEQNVEEIRATGYPDLRLAGDLALSNIAFNTALRELYTALNNGEGAVDERTGSSHQAALTIALMMTKYSSRNTSGISQDYSESNEIEVPLDQLAPQFESHLDKVTALSQDKPEALELLDSARTKWEFIRSSYINYNDNRVNFIVNLYSKKIIEDIEAAATL